MNLPVEIRGFNVTEALWLTRTDQKHICWNEIIAPHAHDISNANVTPFRILDG